MSVGLHELDIGEEIELKGPLGSFQWLGKGLAEWKKEQRAVSNLAFVCGGSGASNLILALLEVLMFSFLQVSHPSSKSSAPS